MGGIQRFFSRRQRLDLVFLTARLKDAEVGVDPSSSSPQEMRQNIQAEMDHYSNGARMSGYQAE